MCHEIAFVERPNCSSTRNHSTCVQPWPPCSAECRPPLRPRSSDSRLIARDRLGGEVPVGALGLLLQRDQELVDEGACARLDVGLLRGQAVGRGGCRGGGHRNLSWCLDVGLRWSPAAVRQAELDRQRRPDLLAGAFERHVRVAGHDAHAVAVDERQRTVGEPLGVAVVQLAARDALGDHFREPLAHALVEARTGGAQRLVARGAQPQLDPQHEVVADRAGLRKALLDHRGEPLGGARLVGRRHLDPRVTGALIGVLECLRQECLT